MSLNGVDSVQVSWTPQSGEAVTGYIIYYQQQDGGHNGSQMAGATTTNATITGLMTGATYSITMVAASSTLPSTMTAAETITIGMSMHNSYFMSHDTRGSITEATISSLMPSTTYSIQVAQVNSTGVGVYSYLHIIQTAGEQCVV